MAPESTLLTTDEEQRRANLRERARAVMDRKATISPEVAAKPSKLDELRQRALQFRTGSQEQESHERIRLQARAKKIALRNNIPLPGTPDLSDSPKDLWQGFGLTSDPKVNSTKKQDYILNRIANFDKELPYIRRGTDSTPPLYPEFNESGIGDALQQRLRKFYSIGYALENQQPSGEEQQQAKRDLINTWLSARHIESALPRERVTAMGTFTPPDRPGGPDTSKPRIVRELPLGQLPEGFNEAEMLDMLAKWQGVEGEKQPRDPTFLASFSPRQRAAWESLRGPDFTRFLDQNQKAQISRNRLELLTGQPSPTTRQQHTLDIAGPATGFHTFPDAYQFRLSDIASKDQELNDWVSRSQTLAEAEQYGREHPGPPLGFNLSGPLQVYTNAVEDLLLKFSPETPETKAELRNFLRANPAIRNLETPAVIPRSVAMGASEILVDAPISWATTALLPLTYTIGPLLHAGAKGVKWTFDSASRLMGGEANFTDRVWTSAMNFVARSIAPHLSQDATNDAKFMARILDNMPADLAESHWPTIQTILKAQPASANLFNFPLLNENPYLRDRIAGFTGAIAGDSTEAIAFFLGTGLVLGQAGRLAAKLKPLTKTPITRNLQYDYVSATAAGAEVARGQLTQRVNKIVDGMTREKDAAPYLRRAVETFKAEGRAVDPVDFGALATKLEAVEQKARVLGDAKISDSTRQALYDTIPILAELGPTEALYTASGQLLKFGDIESARVSQKLFGAMEKFAPSELGETPVLEPVNLPPTIRAFSQAGKGQMSDAELSRLTSSISDYHAVLNQAVNERDRWTGLFQKTVDQISARIPAQAEQIERLNTEFHRIAGSMNDEIATTLANLEHFDKNGGQVPVLPPGAAAPVYRTIAANLTPERTHLRQGIARKINDARAADAEEIIKLTADELNALQSIRNTPFEFAKAQNARRALQKDIKNLTKKYTLDHENLPAIANTFQNLLTAELKPGLKIRLPDKVYKAMREELGNSSQLAVKDGYISLKPGFSTDTLNVLEAFDELTGRIRQDLNLIGGGLKKLSALDMRIMFNGGKGDIIWTVNQLYRDAVDYEMNQLYEFRQLAKEIGKENLSWDEFIEIQKAKSEGRVINEFVDKKLQNAREALLRDGYHVGHFDAATVKKYINNPRYYHGFFSPEDAALLEDTIYPLPGKWNRLSTTENYKKFKRPESGYYVAWEKGGVEQYKPFATVAEAQQWLDSGAKLPDGTALDPALPVDILKGMSFTEKVIREGMVPDPTLSAADLVKELARDISHSALQLNFSRTPLVRSAAEAAITRLEQRGAGIATHYRDTSTGKNWFLVNNPAMRHLNGKYVHEDVVNFLRQHDVGFDFWDNMAHGIQESTGYFDILKGKGNVLINRFGEAIGRGLGPVSQSDFVKWAIRGPQNVIAMGKVALSLPAWFGQWVANIFLYPRAAGMETLDPMNWPAILGNIRDGTAMRLGRSKSDIYYDEIIRNGNLQHSNSKFDADFHNRLDRYHKEPAALLARRDFLNREVQKAHAAGDDELATMAQQEVFRLETRMRELAPKQMRDLMNDAGAVFNQFSREMYESGRRGYGKINAAAWSWFSYPDDIMKYATYRFLREKLNLPKKEALTRIDMYMQNLHRVPTWIKSLTQRFGGSQFVTYPANTIQIVANILRHRPMWFVGNQALLQSWNRLMISGYNEDAEDVLDRWSYTKFRGRRNFLSDQAFLGSRILFPGGRGGIGLGNIGLGLFQSAGPLSKTADRLIYGSDMSLTAKMASGAAANLFSRFVGGQPALQLAVTGLTGADTRGRPYKHWGEWLTDNAARFAPTLGYDAEFLWTAAKDTNIDVFTGRRKTIRDYVKKLFQFLPPEEFSDEALAKVITQSVLETSRGPGHWETTERNETLRSVLWSQGAIRNGKVVNSELAVKLTKEFLKTQDRGLPGFPTDPSKIAKPVNAQQIRDYIRDSTKSGILARIEQMSLSENIDAYAHQKITGGKFHDSDFEKSWKLSIQRKAFGEIISANTYRQLIDIRNRLHQDPEIPTDAKNFIWQALQGALARHDDAAARR